MNGANIVMMFNRSEGNLRAFLTSLIHVELWMGRILILLHCDKKDIFATYKTSCRSLKTIGYNVFGVKWSALVRLNARKKLEVKKLILVD